MLTRIMWFLVMAQCEKGLDNKNLLHSIFGQHLLSSTERTYGTIPTDTLIGIFGPPNATEVPDKEKNINDFEAIFGKQETKTGTISIDTFIGIFGPPKATEVPDKEKNINDFEAIFGKPETTTGKIPTDILIGIFGPPNATEVPDKVTIPTDILIGIFGPPNVTEVPDKGTILNDSLIGIFGPPNATEVPDKEKKMNNFEAIFGKPETTTGPVKSDWPGAYVPCKLQSKEKGICVPYYLCDVCSDLIIVDGKDILDIRVNRDCPDALLVCCLENHAHPKPDTLPLAEQNSTVEKGDVTDGPSEATPPSKKVPPQKTQCGRMQNNGLGVYINERKTSALFGEFPWMVGVLSDESHNWDMTSYLGGGSLIGPRAVLTAAHTVLGRLREEVSLRVRAGEWETKSTSERLPYIEASVEEGIVHDDFNPGTFYNDIALLILETPIERHEHIGYACLPPPDSILPGPSTHCYSMGWGSPNEQSNEYAVFLKKIKMPIVPAEPCQKNLRTTYLSSQFMLHHSFICAGGKENQDSCFGDGGSPLVCPIPGDKHRSAQVGIVAYGVGCGKGHPGLYTNVANFRRWVDKKMAEKKLDTNTYSY